MFHLTSELKRCLAIQNLKFAESSVFIFSKLFDGHTSGGNISMKESEQVYDYI